MTIQYAYARNRAGSLVSIAELTSARRTLEGPFYCLGCEREMLARLGAKLQHCFAHKARLADATCVHETYLHRAAKEAFAQTYRQALQEGRAFELKLRVPRLCTHYQNALPVECASEVIETFDLTKHFTNIGVEAPIDGFRADVLLTSEKAEPLLIEFVVTHRCEPQKIALNHRIIEIAISEETDVAALRDARLIESPKVQLHNFRRRPQMLDVCQGSCEREVEVFIVHRSGKCVIRDMTREAYVRGVPGAPVHVELLGVSPADRSVDELVKVIGADGIAGQQRARSTFRDKVRDAHFAGIPIKNCFLCHHHGVDGIGNAVFCRQHRTSGPSNQAAECKDFQPVKTRHEVEALDTRNARYRDQHGARLVARAFLNTVRRK